ncbi:MAG TPA: RDD family protein [Pyrinomonadaceae bacterium]|jgi:uncharacterized RDD family membrane protein YckC
MQCPSCRAVYSNGLDICPRCQTPGAKSSSEHEPVSADLKQEQAAPPPAAQAVEQSAAEAPAAAAPNSTLIEFPGVSRASRPQWRKELSERVREIQERRARDATGENEEVRRSRPEQTATAEAAAPQLGLVPTQDAPPVNPILAAALKRLERARQVSSPMPRTRSGMGGAATAVARVAEEQYQTEASSEAAAQVSLVVPATVEPQREQAREHTLVVVPAQVAPKITLPAARPLPKRVIPEPGDELAAEPLGTELAEAATDEALYDDRAPVASRIAGSLIDLAVVAFASSPFAAIIELTNGNWADMRVSGAMVGIVLVVMFLYQTASTALAGRTWGMSLVSLRAVDADTGLPPTTRQSIGRALLFMFSLVTLGLGLLYALFDAEGRTAHDHFTQTAVVRE